MRIQVVTGVALMILLFLSALIETESLDVAADRFFFDNHAGAGDARAAVSDKNGDDITPERPLASLPATYGHAR